MNYIFLLFAVELAFICLSYVISRGNLLSPSLITYVMFAFSTLWVIYSIDFWDVMYSFKAVAVSTFGFIAMLLPEFCYYLSSKRRRSLQAITVEFRSIKINRHINQCICLLCVFMALYYVRAVFKRGLSMGGIGLGAIGYSKYGSDITGGPIEKLFYRMLMLLFYSYTYFLLHNVVLCREKVKDNTRYVVPLICYIIAVFFCGNRLGIVKCLLAFYYGIVGLRYYSRTFRKRDVKKVIKNVIVLGSATLVAFYLLRTITKINTTTTNRTFAEYIAYYIGSPVYLFSKYLDNPLAVHGENTYFGEQTLSVLLQSLGCEINITNRFLYVGGESHFAGNAMSWFQRPINDYGILGMFVFTFIVYYFFTHLLYTGVVAKRKTGALIILMYFSYVVVMSFYYCQTMFAVSFSEILYVFIIMVLIKYLPRLTIGGRR